MQYLPFLWMGNERALLCELREVCYVRRFQAGFAAVAEISGLHNDGRINPCTWHRRNDGYLFAGRAGHAAVASRYETAGIMAARQQNSLLRLWRLHAGRGVLALLVESVPTL